MRDYRADAADARAELLGPDRGRLTVFIVVVAGLLAGFAVAQVTGIRPLGGVLVLGAGACAAVVMWRSGARVGVVGAGLVYAAAFGLAHPLGTVIGAWPAAVFAAVVSGAVAFELTKRRKRGQRGNGGTGS